MNLFSEPANLPDLPTTGAVAALVGIATWVIRSGLNRSETESREYRDLLKEALDGLRNDFRNLSDAMSTAAKAQQAAVDANKTTVTEIARLVEATSRLERLLIRSGVKPINSEGV